ncbi:tRNA (adenosine(37)-N6)-dimethylallyltransferase MiaA [Eubacteriales bacterium OttesenSCG-928-K08]|nr:tRNA (adenosine(37)-N6)-dimethylallyltransferase MiaA [Eubacteriales bacterium OttesenSCG-928-K08]
MLLGPTASGKTEASILLAKALGARIVSADSIQVYRGLDIGSAKPTMEERAGIAHHMLDVVEIDCPDFSVSQYQQMANACIENIRRQNSLPLVAGGTGFYIQALTNPMELAGVPGNPELRARLSGQEFKRPGCLHERLTEIDPARAAKIHPNDTKRIIRALEIFEASGQLPSAYGEPASALSPTSGIKLFGITMPRELLYERINKRVDIMLEAGLLEEARAIFDMGYALTLPAMQALGYRQLFSHFNGECSLEEAIERIKQETRRYAKRQTTWFKRDPNILWFDKTQYPSVKIMAEQMLKAYDSMPESES